MKDSFKSFFFKYFKINLRFFFFCQGISLCLKITSNEIRKSIFDCISFSLLQKNIRTGVASYQGKSNVCKIHSHSYSVPKNNRNKEGVYGVTS